MHIFYRTRDLTIGDKIQLIEFAKTLSERWWLDILKSGSYRRERIDMGFDEIINKFNNTCHFVVILRKDPADNSTYGEIGFSTITESPEYFLFIHLKTKEFFKVINKFNLRENGY